MPTTEQSTQRALHEIERVGRDIGDLPDTFNPQVLFLMLQEHGYAGLDALLEEFNSIQEAKKALLSEVGTVSTSATANIVDMMKNAEFFEPRYVIYIAAAVILYVTLLNAPDNKDFSEELISIAFLGVILVSDFVVTRKILQDLRVHSKRAAQDLSQIELILAANYEKEVRALLTAAYKQLPEESKMKLHLSSKHQR